MSQVWSPKGYRTAPTLTPGIYVIEILGISEGRTPKRSLFMLQIKARMLGQTVLLTLIWGSHAAVDRRNGQIVARLHEVAALSLSESPDWERLAEELAGVPLEVRLGVNAEKMEPQLHQVIGEAPKPNLGAEVTTEEAPDYIQDDWDGEDDNTAEAGGALG